MMAGGKEKSAAWEAGYEAYLEGEDETNNPHEEKGSEHEDYRDWNDGWMCAQDGEEEEG